MVVEIDRTLKMIIDRNEDGNKGIQIKAVCLQCQTIRQQTNHRVLKSYRIVGTNFDYPYIPDEDILYDYFRSQDEGLHQKINRSDEFQIIQCLGCETVTFRELHWNDQDNKGLQETLHPKRSIGKIKEKYFPNLPSKVLGIYKETVHNYNAENFILCSAGLRAIVESICTNQDIKDGPLEVEKPNGEKVSVRKNTLEGKIYGLSEKGILAKGHADILHEYRFLGNSALHELEKPSAEELALAIEIIEHILESVFEMPVKGNVLKGRRVNNPEVEPSQLV